MRIAVDIPDDQLAELTRVAERESVSPASLMRDAIAALLAEKRKTGDAAIDAAFGIWADHKEDSLVIERRLRDEWDREWDTF
jgi:metal-responsive CopG/Arc/MetJ family transcriptional regulator